MLRNFTPSDRKDFIGMCKDFYSSEAVLHPVSEKSFERTFDFCLKENPYARGFIFENEGQTAGYSLVSFAYSNEAGGMTAWIEELYLKKEFRKKGLGKVLLSETEEKIKEKTKRIRLEVTENNLSAINLYRKNGYTDLNYLQFVKETLN